MMFPLNLWDISLLLAAIAIILIITSELLSTCYSTRATYYGKVSILINKRRLRNTAIIFSLLFLITVAIRAAGIILNQ